MKKNKVVCIGEALIDRIRNKSNQGFTDFLGGAPANVACALRKLNIDSIFIGNLGNDDFDWSTVEDSSFNNELNKDEESMYTSTMPVIEEKATALVSAPSSSRILEVNLPAIN